MTIEKFTFQPPLHVTNIDHGEVLRFLNQAQREVVPPDHCRDVTPPPMVGKGTVMLRTKISRRRNTEDTIGQLDFTVPDRKATVHVNEDNPLAAIFFAPAPVIAKGFDISSVIRYTPGDGSGNSLTSGEEVAEPVESLAAQLFAHVGEPVERT